MVVFLSVALVTLLAARYLLCWRGCQVAMWLHDGDKTNRCLRTLAKRVACIFCSRKMQTLMSYADVELLDMDTQGAVNLERPADFQ